MEEAAKRFCKAPEFSGVERGDGEALPERGLGQANISQAVVKRGSVDLAVQRQGLSGQRINEFSRWVCLGSPREGERFV